MANNIDRQALKDSVDRGDVTIVDTLGGGYYEAEHLPGAVSLVADAVVAEAPDVLPDRDAMIVTYCTNSGCANSGIVAHMLTKLGYSNVHRYEAGIEDWVGAGLPTEKGAARAVAS